MGVSLIPQEVGIYVSHDVAGSNEHATIIRSAGGGAGAAGEDRACPGWVVDGVCEACYGRERGMFSYDLVTPAGSGQRRRASGVQEAQRPCRAPDV